MTLNVGDVRYFQGIPVTICELEELGGEVKFAKIKWFEGTNLHEKKTHIANLLTMPEYPNYNDYMKFAEGVGLLDDIGSSDTLEEFMLNDAVYSLVESLAKYNIPQDEIVDAVYDITYKLQNSFKYLEDCNFVAGYESAVLIAKDKNEEVGRSMMEDVLKGPEEYQG